MQFTWYDQDRFSSKWFPKIFFVWTLSIVSPLCITLNNSLLFRLCFWLSWVVENSINLSLSSLKNNLLLEDHSDMFLAQSLILQCVFRFSVLNVCTGWNHQYIVRNRRWRFLLNRLCISWRGQGLKCYPVAHQTC